MLSLAFPVPVPHDAIRGLWNEDASPPILQGPNNVIRKPRKRMYSKMDAVPAVGAPPPLVPVAQTPLLRLPRAHSARFQVPPERLAWRCDPAELPFRSTRDVAPLRGILGQRQALHSLKLGLSVPSPGYNVFICGLSGTDSLSLVERFLRPPRRVRRPSPDRCYVQNFGDPQRPKLLELPAGQGPSPDPSRRGRLRSAERESSGFFG
jgi:hypothetical protein